MSMTAEQQQIVAEFASMCEAAQAAGIDVIATLNVTTPEMEQPHNISTRMSVEDNHHVGDMLCSIMECWHKANQEADGKDGLFLTALTYLLEHWWKANHKE